jgi:PhzF family phenazine biosynthesis protein
MTDSAIYRVNLFGTNGIGSGCPITICRTTQTRDEIWMQKVASEMMRHETVFLSESPEGYSFRCFTPTREVNSCCDAALACAHILNNVEGKDLPVTLKGQETFIVNLEHRNILSVKCTPIKTVTIRETDDWQNILSVPVKRAAASTNICILEVDSANSVRSVSPDYKMLIKARYDSLIVTARSSISGYDIISRHFAPKQGIEEYPASGTAHRCLLPFWQSVLLRDSLIGTHASSREGTIQVKSSNGEVLVAGSVVTIFQAVLMHGCASMP